MDNFEPMEELKKFDNCKNFKEFNKAEKAFIKKAENMTKAELLSMLCLELRREMNEKTSFK